MKLNSDCVRGVMLALEELLCIDVDEDGAVCMDTTDLDAVCKSVPEFDAPNVFYALHNLEQAGYIEMSTEIADNGVVCACIIEDITFDGHEFLNQIRDKDHWAVVKAGLAKARDFSLSAISSIAEGVAKAAIDKYIGTLHL